MQLSEVFYWLLSMSISASVCSIIIMLIRLIPGIPKNFIRHLWLIPFIRLVIPFGFQSRYGLMQLTAKLTRTVAVPVETSVTDLKLLAMNHVVMAEKYVPFTYKTDMVRKIFEIASTVWICAAFVLLCFFFLTYILTAVQFSKAEHSHRRVYFSDKAVSPLLLGIISPKIILPQYLKGRDNGHIIRHEICHMRALDNFSRLTAVTVCCIHWFNPFIWFMLKFYISDLEYACDERTVKNYTAEQKKEYSLSLIDAKRKISPIVSGFTSGGFAGRINAIMSYGKISFIASVFLTVFFVFICYILLSNGDVSSV